MDDTELLPVAINHVEKGRFLTVVGDGNAGAALDAALKMFFADQVEKSSAEGSNVYECLQRQISPEDRNGVLFVPHLLGTMLDSTATSGLLGLRSSTDRRVLIKAILEGILLGYYANVSLLPNLNAVGKIWLTGGGSRGDVTGQIMADVFQCDVTVAEDSELPARGAAACALKGLGRVQSFSDAPLPGVRRYFIPNPEMADYYAAKAELIRRVLLGTEDLLKQVSKLS
ncbi:MAG: hypothetical protein JRH01_12840 [Deltaproteobacteria bacterium]|nr:hypothetical protein [Deltaproteobacteria bacterium]